MSPVIDCVHIRVIYCHFLGIGSVNITNVSVSYHNITWATSTRIDGVVNSTTHEPFINMKCSFASMSEAGLNYQIMWYIYADNRTHVYNETVMSSSGDSSVVSLMSVNRTLGFEVNVLFHFS